MHSELSETPRQCVYDVPLALDGSSGFEPDQAMARNLAESRTFTLGPMPVRPFLDTFLPTSPIDKGRIRSSKKAFTSIPATAESASGIYVPLVSFTTNTSCYTL